MSSKVYLATKNDLGALQATGVGVGEVGVVTWQYTLLANHLKLDGTTVLGAEYPLLLAFAVNHALITTDADNKVLFKYDETTDVLALPDLMGLCVQGGANVVQMAAGVQNIKGDVYNWFASYADDGDPTGCFTTTKRSGANNFSIGEAEFYGKLGFDASRSSEIYNDDVNTVQPPAVTLIPQIRYAADVTRGSNYTIGATDLWEDMVGHVLYDVVLRDGFIKANWASVELESTSVPRLVAFVREHPDLLGDGPALYKYAEAEDTLTLPNFTARVLQGGESVGSLEAGLPDAKGVIGNRGGSRDGLGILWNFDTTTKKISMSMWGPDGKTVFSDYSDYDSNYPATTGAGYVEASTLPTYTRALFALSNYDNIYGASSTVQPPAITLIPQIKY